MNKTIKSKLNLFNIAIFIVLVLYCLTMISVLMWGLFTSLKTVDDFYSNKVFLPSGAPWEWAWSNYSYVFKNFKVTSGTAKYGMDVLIFNSLAYAGGGSLIECFSMCTVAYMVAKYKFKFSKCVYIFVVITMVVPVIGSTPSMLLLWKKVGLYGTFLSVYIMKFHFLGMYFLVFYSIFQGISSGFSEAAKIDGASEFTIMFKINFPLITPTFLTVFLILFISMWNNYQDVIIYLPKHPTLAYSVYHMAYRERNAQFAYETFRLTSCMILAVPMIVLFIIFRNKIMGNVTMGGVKE